MLDRTVVAFDIETIPDPDFGRRALGIEGEDADVVGEMVERRLEETKGSTEYPQLPMHRIVTVCATSLDPASGAVTIRKLGGAAMDERSHVEGFSALLRASPRIVSWNGGGFDLPVLRYRGMLLGVAAPELYRDPYLDRRGDLHVDLMDVLSGYGASSRVGLGTLSTALGLPGKSFLSRAIYEHVLAGETEVVDEYCKLDTVLTMYLFLAFAFHTGAASRGDVDRFSRSLRACVASQPFGGWHDLDAVLAKWPPWS
ncbi:MAG TPA: ribonuclease H-like domain-containing protein [Labilithrix sp.]